MTESLIIRNRKYYKRNKILNLIRSNQNISRNDIKKMTLYSIPTVRSIVDELIAEGLVWEEECDDPRVGRKPVWIHLNPNGAFFVGVEFNARYLHCAMLNFVGEVVCRSEETIDAFATSETLLSLIIRHVGHCLEQVPSGKGHCYGICVGAPGYIDQEKRTAISYSHLKNWENVPVCSILEKHFTVPCYMENNVNVMALAYKWLYYNGAAQDFIFVSIRTGVRMVPVVDNKLILSKTGFSGQLGHIKIPTSSRICSCGKFGCLNSEISDEALLNIIEEGFRVGHFADLHKLVEEGGALTMAAFRTSVQQGHADSISLMRRTAKTLGETLSIVVNIFAPESIVLSGELSALGDPFIQEVYSQIAKNIIEENLHNLKISVSAFDKYIGATGAAAYVMQEEFEFIDKQV